MKVTVLVTIQGDDGTPTVVHEVFTLERGASGPRAPWGSAWTRPRTCSPAVQDKMVERAGQGCHR